MAAAKVPTLPHLLRAYSSPFLGHQFEAHSSSFGEENKK